MSLINEALKKAQRQRHGDAPVAAGEDGRVAKRAQPKSATSMVILVAGAVVLVALSIVATTLWLTRPSTPAVASAKPATPAAKAPDSGNAPVVVVPVITPAAPPPATSTAPAPAAPSKPEGKSPSTDAAPGSNATPPSPGTAAPSAEAKPAPAAAPANPEEPAAPPKPNEQIHKFVEALHVTGIRSSGTESKVLMNDRVYRVNDIVDRTLGVRLTQVSPDSLTFTDANGATYVKYF